MKGTFICKYCKKSVKNSKLLGNTQRNHCPYCLWSRHVDEKKPGDRKSLCKGLMEPIGLVFKNEKIDKFGVKRHGEIMLIHLCNVCGKISLNRLSADDNPEIVLDVFNFSKTLPEEVMAKLNLSKIEILQEKDREEINKQIFGAR